MLYAPRILLLALTVTLSLRAPAQHAVFRSYTVSNGLSNNAIRKVYQDSHGFIWIATWEGLNKYDGHRFTRYTTANGLPHSMINDVFETPEREMLVVMNDGHISRIRKGQLLPHPFRSKYVINRLIEDPHKGLLGTTDFYGVVKLENDSIVRTDGRDNFSLFGIVQWRNYYIAIGDHHPVMVYDSSLKLRGTATSSPLITRCLFPDQQGRVWMGSSAGLWIVDLSDFTKPEIKAAPYPYNHPLLRAGEVTAIHQDHNGDLWFGTYNGLVRVARNGHTRIYTERDGLPGLRISSISSDRERNLWVGTYSGLAKLPYQSVELVAAPSGSFFEGQLFAVQKLADSQLVVVASDAIYRYHTGRHQAQHLFRFAPGESATPISGSQPFSIIYLKRVYTVNGERTAMQPGAAFPTDYIFSAAQFNKQICAAHNGISILFSNGSVVRVLDSLRMHCVTWDREGTIWAGSWDDGLFRIRLDTLVRTVTSIEKINAIPGVEQIRALHEDRKGNIWVGTRYHGIFVLTAQGEGKLKVTHLDQHNGMMSDWIYSFTETADGNIWVATLAGISKVLSSAGGFRVFNFSRAVNFYAVANWLMDSGNNELWGTSDRGLFRFSDLKLENEAPLPVYFTEIRMGKADTNFAAGAADRKVRLRFNENYLHFEFTSPGFLNERELLYSFRLKGSGDTSWSSPSNIHSVEYASLKPGNYVFEVKMKGWNGVYGEPSTFAFVINRPFWQSWWFYLAAAVLAIFVVLLIFRYRTKQLMRLQRVRTAIATDLHDDIGSSLTNISILSQLSLDKIHKPELAGNFLTRIRNEVQQSSQALDDIIWSVNVRNDSLAETLARMRRFAGDIFDNSETACHLQIDEDLSDRKLNMALRRDLYLIYKEIINNVRKHSAAQNVWVRISGSDDRIRLVVKDDGKGFDSNQVSERNGLKNLKYRVAKWNGTLEIESRPGKGSSILVVLPLKE